MATSTAPSSLSPSNEMTLLVIGSLLRFRYLTKSTIPPS